MDVMEFLGYITRVVKETSIFWWGLIMSSSISKFLNLLIVSERNQIYISGNGHAWSQSLGCLEFPWPIVRKSISVSLPLPQTYTQPHTFTDTMIMHVCMTSLCPCYRGHFFSLFNMQVPATGCHQIWQPALLWRLYQFLKSFTWRGKPFMFPWVQDLTFLFINLPQ